MDFKQISDLIKLVNKTNLIEFKLKDGEFEISMRTEKYKKSQSPVISAVSTEVPQVSVVPSAPAPVAEAPVSPPSERPAEPDHDAQEKEDNLVEIRSPMVGTFYRSPSPDKPPYIKVGDRIEVGSVVCIVEAMKLFNEIESEISGTIVKVVTEDASPVEYDQVLFLVEP